jgi:hypothetical protein
MKMRINRNMLLKLANDAVEKYVSDDRTLMAIYLQGSLLGDNPLIGNTADIDLFFIHSDESKAEREIVRISDEIHLDISHHSHVLYRQPRELRLHSWLGPAIYGCKILYDPQHFVDFVQASVRGQFNNPENVLSRVRKQAEHAREMWEAFINDPHLPDPHAASLYLRALEHAANSVAGLSGQNLTERRFLTDLPPIAESVSKPGLYPGFLGLLGAPTVDVAGMRSWLNDWRDAYIALPCDNSPIHLSPHRLLYYERALDAMLNSENPHDALWPLWHSWTQAIGTLPADSANRSAWQKAGEQLGLLGAAFEEKIAGLDAYLDQVEELLEDWAREHGE